VSRQLSVASLAVLHAVASGVHHGFDIIDATELPGGTVYPALSRLERDEYVSSSWEPITTARAEGRPPRRYYTVTPDGLRTLNAALAKLHALKPIRTMRLSPVRSKP
jgi:PadR family transcriptional regulator PadR